MVVFFFMNLKQVDVWILSSARQLTVVCVFRHLLQQQNKEFAKLHLPPLRLIYMQI